MHFLDTNICIAFLNGLPGIQATFEAHRGDLAVPAIVAAELFSGFRRSARVERNLPRLESFLDRLSVVDFDLQAARAYGNIQGHLKTLGRPTGIVDAMIASVVISRHGTLVTHNVRDFVHIPHLTVEDWLA